MSDLVERLRAADVGYDPPTLFTKAADTIATLTAERDEAKETAQEWWDAYREQRDRVARLEEALRDAAKRLLGAGMLGGPEDPVVAALAQEDKP